jgi:hypothetical protein
MQSSSPVAAVTTLVQPQANRTPAAGEMTNPA